MIIMYMKFKVDVTDDKDIIGNYYECGQENNFTEYKKKIKEKLDSCINYQKNYIDGNKLEKIFFKEIEADVFISHSHIDKNLAIAISEWLYKEMGLTAFVDSCDWDYVEEYLDELNNRYNIIKREYKHQTYGYRKANYFASHLYLMLNSALNHMLDKTECNGIIIKIICYHIHRNILDIGTSHQNRIRMEIETSPIGCSL